MNFTYPTPELQAAHKKVLAIKNTLMAAGAPGPLSVCIGPGREPFKGWHHLEKDPVILGLLKEGGHSFEDADGMDWFTDRKDDTVDAIYSSHSLEHFPIRRAEKAFREWARTLKPGGTLYLAVPDMKLQCQIMASDNIPDDWKIGWFLYTMYGFQADTDKYAGDRKEFSMGRSEGALVPDCRWQYHTTAFWDSYLIKLATACGLVVVDMFSYDGYNTPSIWCEFRKREQFYDV